MAGGVRTARWVLVGVALTLVAVLAGLVGYSRYRAVSFLKGLPGKLGIDIEQESDNFTYSQSLGGKTVFTVHAGKQDYAPERADHAARCGDCAVRAERRPAGPGARAGVRV